MAKAEVVIEPAPEPTLDVEVWRVEAERRLAAVEERQEIHQQALEQFMSALKEHDEETGKDPQRIDRLESVTSVLTNALEIVHGTVMSMLQGRRR